MCVETLRNRAHFSEMINLRIHMPRFTLNNEHFPIYLFRNSLKCVLKPSEYRVHFSETIDLRGHMPSFTLKNESYPIYLLRNPINVC